VNGGYLKRQRTLTQRQDIITVTVEFHGRPKSINYVKSVT
jgi:hypothetical protein